MPEALMARMRARLFVLLFFSLISLGQAYPFSYAYALGQEDTCNCRRSGHECMHGCLLKRGGHGCCHHPMAGSAGHSEDRRAGVTDLPCGGKSKQEILSFRSDPFLPAAQGIMLAPLRRIDFLEFDFFLISLLHAPETPPPRSAFAA